MSEVNTNRLVSTFCELVKIPSESPNDQEFIEHLGSLFKMMGGKTKKDDYGNLIAKFDAKNSRNTAAVAFNAHADTVKPGLDIEPVVENGMIKSKGQTILGADDKAAIAEIMEMIRSAEKHPPIEVIITRCEEIGSYGSAALDSSLVSAKMVYVLDSDVINGIIVGGPSLVALDVTYTGKPAHAGMTPEKGISAILAASKAVSRLRLGKLDEETTANVGTFNGGQIRNGIPADAVLLAECRCLKHEKALAVADEMEKIFREASDEVGTTINIKRSLMLKAYLLSETSPVVQQSIKALKKNGLTPEIKIIRGGSDATFLNEKGLPAAVLGVGYRDMHSCAEYAIIDEMVTMTKVIKSIVEDLA